MIFELTCFLQFEPLLYRLQHDIEDPQEHSLQPGAAQSSEAIDTPHSNALSEEFYRLFDSALQVYQWPE
jgi:hypothetical protein